MEPARPASTKRTPAPTQALAFAIAAAALIGALLIGFALRATEMRGDEVTYVHNARIIADFIASRGGDISATFDQVMGAGWFMPGLAVLGAPLFLIAPDAPNWLIVSFIGAVNAALFALALAALTPAIGRRYVWLLLLYPALAPLWLVGALSFLPDLPAGLLATIALGLAYRIALSMVQGQSPGWRLILALELCLIAAFYLRGPMLLFALALHAFLIVLALSLQGPRIASAARAGAGLALFVATVAPWSIAASAHFDYPVISTTNVPLVLADGFGDRTKTCFGPCPEGRDIIPAWNFAKAQAAQTGENRLAVERAMMTASLEGLTLRQYLVQVREHFGRYLLDPGAWLRVKLELSFAIPPDLRGPLYLPALGATLIVYAPFLLALLAANIMPIRSSDALALQAMLIKVMTACLFLQPFVHKSSARYWTASAAIGTWAAIMLVKWWRERDLFEDRTHRVIPAWIDQLQVIYAGVFVLVTAAILLA